MRRMVLVLLVLAVGGFGCAVQGPAQQAGGIDPDIAAPSYDSCEPVFHFPPADQGDTSVCWSYATVSYLESEAHRLGFAPVKMAVMYPVYFAYVEEARHFVQQKGESRFTPGDLFHTVLQVVQKHGIVPERVYPARAGGAGKPNHKELYRELLACIAQVKKDALWDEAQVVAKVRSILDKHLGAPPEKFVYEGRLYTPRSFQQAFMGLPWEDYLYITSFQYAPFGSHTDLRVPDYWPANSRYYNVPLEAFYQGLKVAVQGGYSVAIDGDISEPGRLGERDIAVIPAYDIPSASITQEAREYRFDRKITTDDHLMHVVGMTRTGGHDWFLVKDSWRDAWKGDRKGYFLYRDDFVKLKVLAYLVHKDAMPDLGID